VQKIECHAHKHAVQWEDYSKEQEQCDRKICSLLRREGLEGRVRVTTEEERVEREL
jgi:hypothetical protein